MNLKVRIIVGRNGHCHEVFPRDYILTTWPGDMNIKLHCYYVFKASPTGGETIKEGYDVYDEKKNSFHVSTRELSFTHEGYVLLAEKIAEKLPHNENIIALVH